MLLSEAIRLGAMLKPQRFGPPTARVALRLEPSSCALTAAAEAAGDRDLNVFGEFRRRWPVSEQDVSCPQLACDLMKGKLDLSGVIAHLNDRHCWTRERIADFVETIEQEQAADAVARVEGRVTSGPRA